MDMGQEAGSAPNTGPGAPNTGPGASEAGRGAPKTGTPIGTAALAVRQHLMNNGATIPLDVIEGALTAALPHLVPGWQTEPPPEHGYYLAAWKRGAAWTVSELWYNPPTGWWASRGYLHSIRDSSLRPISVAAWMPMPAYQDSGDPPPVTTRTRGDDYWIELACGHSILRRIHGGQVASAYYCRYDETEEVVIRYERRTT